MVEPETEFRLALTVGVARDVANISRTAQPRTPTTTNPPTPSNSHLYKGILSR